EDWWSQARPVFEIHGYYRVRAELFHNFALGRRDLPYMTPAEGETAAREHTFQLWPQPTDNFYKGVDGNDYGPKLCGDDPLTLGPCEKNTQAGANMRFRLNPELHISDNLRVLSQIDLLDNLVLGSTPEGYTNVPGAGGGYSVVARGGYAPQGAFA